MPVLEVAVALYQHRERHSAVLCAPKESQEMHRRAIVMRSRYSLV